jgi:hypothetical protein
VVTLHSKQWVENNPNDPSVNSNGEQLISFKLTQDEMNIFSKPTIYLNLVFNMEGSNGQQVSIKGTTADHVRVKSMIKAKLHVTEDI